MNVKLVAVLGAAVAALLVSRRRCDPRDPASCDESLITIEGPGGAVEFGPCVAFQGSGAKRWRGPDGQVYATRDACERAAGPFGTVRGGAAA